MLGDYLSKRSEQSPEPTDGGAPNRGPLLFVIQKHAATNVHFDLRLETAGVLKSWAIPKGPSYDPADKRFAAHTEDHPFSYAGFEGVIPTGTYGAGEMIVWDMGTWFPDEIVSWGPKAPSQKGEVEGWRWDDPDWRADVEARVLAHLEAGKLSVFFRGQRMHGSWALVRTKEGWLFFKHADRWKGFDPNPLRHETSVLTGRTLTEVKRLGKAATGLAVNADQLMPSKPEPYPAGLHPMKADVAERPFDSPAWLFEPKMDGIRVLAYVRHGAARLVTRNGNDQTSQFPEVTRHLCEQRGDMVLDAEIVAFEDGRPGFTPMMKRFHLKDRQALDQADRLWPCVLYAFDLLHLDGFDLRGLTTLERKRHLASALLPTERIQRVDHLMEHGTTFYEAVVAAGFEGAIAKRVDARYDASGRKSSAWLKIKHTDEQSFVVGGFTPGVGGRVGFGAMYLGFPSAEDPGKLEYVGRVGTGFDEASLLRLRESMESLAQEDMPFLSCDEVEPGTVWLRPEMVVDVKFSERMPSGHLRAPVFLRERPDLAPDDCAEAAPRGPRPERTPLPSVGMRTEEPPTVPQGPDAPIQQVLAQLESKEKNLTLIVEEGKVAVTNLDKVLWPETETLPAFTKRDLLRYLARVSPYMIPHTRRRPMTLIRWPDGINAEKFFQKHWEQSKPDFVRVISLWGDTNKRNQDYVDCDCLGTLLWLGQLGTLEFHVPAARIDPEPDGHDLSQVLTDSEENIDASILNFPDFIRFDIDPYIYSGKEKAGEEPELNREAFEKGKTVAYWIRDLAEGLGMKTYVKTTGKTGLHIFVPILRNLETKVCRDICGHMCSAVLRQHPRDVTMEWSVTKRTGKIFLDHNMNAMGKTLGAAYSPRALPNQSLSMPLTWDELEGAYPEDFTMRNAFDWLDRRGDVWADILDAKVNVASLFGAG